MPDASPAPVTTATTALPASVPAQPPAMRASWKDIHRSPLNPRKHFDELALSELADSIGAQGLLQNLVVRPHPTKAGEYELLAGERRHRAFEILVKTGRAKPEDQLPVQIRKLDDTEASLLALAENMARNDLTPSEEAEAFSALKEKGLLPAEIGRRIGKTERFVQKRIRLKRDLAPAAWNALVAGELMTEQANAIAMAPVGAQKDLLEQAARGFGAEELQDIATEKLVPVGKQCFPIELYNGEFVVVDEVTGAEPTRWFKNTAQVQTLAKAALDVKVEQLKKKYPFVEVKKSPALEKPWDWEEAKAGDKNAGALVMFSAARAMFKVHAPVTKPKPRQSTGGAANYAQREYDYGFKNHVQGIIADTLLTALETSSGTTLQRFAALTVLAQIEEWHLKRAPQAIRERWEDLTDKIDIDDPATAWKATAKLDAKALGEILALSTLIVTTDSDHLIGQDTNGDMPFGVQPWVKTLAAEIKADIWKTWEFYGKQADAFLEDCGIAQLKRIALDLKIEVAEKADDKALRSAIAKNVAANRKYMPPWLAFATPGEIAKAAKAAPAAAETKPATKKKG